MNGLSILIIITTIIRGLGAGMILGVSIMTLPVRKRLGVILYSKFIQAHYKEKGVKVYAAITITGLLLTVWALIAAYQLNQSFEIKSAIAVSLMATIVGLVGTAGAFPAMIKLWKNSNELTEAQLTLLLNKFGSWSMFSAVIHIVSFISIVFTRN